MDNLKNCIKVDTFIDLYNYEDISGDFKIISCINGKYIPLRLYELDMDAGLVILHDDFHDEEDIIERRCGTCALCLDNNICEYFNKEVSDSYSCDEWLFMKE